MKIKNSYALLALCFSAMLFAADPAVGTKEWEKEAEAMAKIDALKKKHENLQLAVIKTAVQECEAMIVQQSATSRWFSPTAWVQWGKQKVGWVTPLTEKDKVNFDTYILRLCLIYREGNLPIIAQQLKEHPEFDINSNLQSEDCGGVTLMHANLWFWRSYYKTPENRTTFVKTMQVFLDRGADPDVAFADCLTLDQDTGTASNYVLNSAYKHALYVGDADLVTRFDVQRKKLNHALQKEVIDVDFLWMGHSAGSFVVLAKAGDTLITPPGKYVLHETLCDDPIADNIYRFAIQYKADNLPKIKRWLSQIKNIDAAFKTGLTLPHALLCHWRNEVKDKKDVMHDVFIETQKMFLAAGANPQTELPDCVVYDQPTRSRHQDTYNSLYKYSTLADDRALAHLFNNKGDSQVVKAIVTWHDSDDIRWSTEVQ